MPDRVPFSFHAYKSSVFISYRLQMVFMPASCEQESLSVMILFRFQIITASCERSLRLIAHDFPIAPSPELVSQ